MIKTVKAHHAHLRGKAGQPSETTHCKENKDGENATVSRNWVRRTSPKKFECIIYSTHFVVWCKKCEILF
jgi:hypothetical protein